MSTTTLSVWPTVRWLRRAKAGLFSATEAADAAVVANARRQSTEARTVFMEFWRQYLGIGAEPVVARSTVKAGRVYQKRLGTKRRMPPYNLFVGLFWLKWAGWVTISGGELVGGADFAAG
jgi:hypothetical protein